MPRSGTVPAKAKSTMSGSEGKKSLRKALRTRGGFSTCQLFNGCVNGCRERPQLGASTAACFTRRIRWEQQISCSTRKLQLDAFRAFTQIHNIQVVQPAKMFRRRTID